MNNGIGNSLHKDFILMVKAEGLVTNVGRIMQQFTRRRMEVEILLIQKDRIDKSSGQLLLMARSEKETIETIKKQLERIVEVEEVIVFGQHFFI